MPRRSRPARQSRPAAALRNVLVCGLALCVPAAAGPPDAARPSGDAAGAAAEARRNLVTRAPGDSSASAAREAERALPLAAMSPQARGRVRAVLDGRTMFRTLPVLQFPIHGDSLDFFTEHPDVAVALWRVLGVSQCEMWQVGPGSFEADAKDGSVGAFDVVHRGPGDRVVLAQGQFKSPVLPEPIRADAVFHLTTRTFYDAAGTPHAVARGSLFVSFPSAAIAAAVRIISPVTNRILDRNFEEICLFAHLMDRSMQTRPGWVNGLAARMDGVLPDRPRELTAVTARVRESGDRRAAAARGVRVSPAGVRRVVR